MAESNLLKHSAPILMHSGGYSDEITKPSFGSFNLYGCTRPPDHPDPFVAQILSRTALTLPDPVLGPRMEKPSRSTHAETLVFARNSPNCSSKSSLPLCRSLSSKVPQVLPQTSPVVSVSLAASHTYRRFQTSEDLSESCLVLSDTVIRRNNSPRNNNSISGSLSTAFEAELSESPAEISQLDSGLQDARQRSPISHMRTFLQRDVASKTKSFIPEQEARFTGDPFLLPSRHQTDEEKRFQTKLFTSTLRSSQPDRIHAYSPGLINKIFANNNNETLISIAESAGAESACEPGLFSPQVPFRKGLRTRKSSAGTATTYTPSGQKSEQQISLIRVALGESTVTSIDSKAVISTSNEAIFMASTGRPALSGSNYCHRLPIKPSRVGYPHSII
ncbi:unnamed protein product [Protopolystoma xenopodis]|uniref:Uncharacterized protein n=1 Tax=Protopolystoma xenopodis TaxID=117903 RepID=A0A3S5C5E2_9PLAT|nr:unnamed protein product [Protopolystoma xenopodis]